MKVRLLLSNDITPGIAVADPTLNPSRRKGGKKCHDGDDKHRPEHGDDIEHDRDTEPSDRSTRQPRVAHRQPVFGDPSSDEYHRVADHEREESPGTELRVGLCRPDLQHLPPEAMRGHCPIATTTAIER